MKYLFIAVSITLLAGCEFFDPGDSPDLIHADAGDAGDAGDVGDASSNAGSDAIVNTCINDWSCPPKTFCVRGHCNDPECRTDDDCSGEMVCRNHACE